MKNNFHPSRSELIIAAKSSSSAVKKHLADCDWCHMFFELLSRFQTAGQLPLVSAPPAWIER
ncbi:MAG TPA: hypothetical protein VHP63_07395, partial [candidate division Zixibacteria bacterium]|nr:hypothetical protein [candidate division Zixibacteria bacterium]